MRAKSNPRYDAKMREAMLLLEDVAGDTEAPMKERLNALRRIRDFCNVILTEFDPTPKQEAEA